MRASRSIGLVLAASLLAGCGDEAALPRVPRLGRFELPLDTPDPAGVRATFTSPTGRAVDVGAFPTHGKAALRFAPSELGVWSYRAADAAGKSLATGSFRAVASSDHGFVRVDASDRHHLRFDDGARFFVLGENRINIYDPSWNYEKKSIPDYVAYMAENGMTTLRVFVFTDAQAEDRKGGEQLGCLEPKMGVFDDQAAADFDAIFDAAEKHGVYVVLTAFALGFSPPPDTWKSWADNPYAAANGGVCKDRFQFFDDEDARAHAKERLRYIVNRWGSSTHLLAIDLLNEPEWDGEIGEDPWIPWAEELADDLRAHDPYGHLVTVGSVGLSWNVEGDERRFYGDARDDMIQWHLYGPDFYEPHALALEMDRRVREVWSYDKPVFCGEFAYGGEDKTTYDHTHDGIWSAFFAGGGAVAHSAPPFTIDSDEYMTPARGAHFRALRRFVDALDPAMPLVPGPLADGAPAGTKVWSIGGPDARAVWALAPVDGYGEPVKGARLPVPDLAPGRYLVTYWDDEKGAVFASDDETVGADHAIAPPPFVRHVAAVVTRAPAR
ncbi:MAG TPA: cellulase family glycosylhydrolase [Minicystis sp.]|nr:cellulase family glycosylhydrolase [Minicystis sp.]